MEVKDFISGVLSNTLNMDETGVASLYKEDGTIKDDALETIKLSDQQRISGITETGRSSGYKEAERKVKEKLEKELRTVFGVDSKREGIELVQEIVSAKVQAAGGSTPEITPDLVMKHPTYKELQSKLETEVQNATKPLQEQLNALKQNEERAKLYGRVFEIAEPELLKLNPKLPENDARRQNQLRLFRDEITSYTYEFKEGNALPLIIDPKDSKVIVNAHGYPVKFPDFIKQIAEKYWDFAEAKKDPAPDPKKKGQGAGNPGTDPDATVNDYPLVKPSNDAEYSQMLSKITNDSALSQQQSAKIKQRLIKLYRGGE